MHPGSRLWLFRVDYRRVARVRVRVEVYRPAPHLVEKMALLVRHVRVQRLPHLLDQQRQHLNESVASALLKVQLKMAISGQQFLERSAGTLQVGRAEDRELDLLAIEVGNGDVKGGDLGVGLFVDEYDTVVGEISLV